MKQCNKCGKELPPEKFHSHASHEDRLSSSCRQCVRNSRRSISGVVRTIYFTQRNNSRLRGYVYPNYTLKELWDWLVHNDNFIILYDRWVSGGHKRNMKPSCDRLDDYKSYSFDNIQVITFGDNNKKATDSRLHAIGKSGNACKGVAQYDINHNFIKNYGSMSIAGRENGINFKLISRACHRENGYSHGYYWKIIDKINS